MNTARNLLRGNAESARRCPLGHRFAMLHLLCSIRGRSRHARLSGATTETWREGMRPSLRAEAMHELEAYFLGCDTAAEAMPDFDSPAERARARFAFAASLVVPMLLVGGLLLVPTIAGDHALAKLLRFSQWALMLPLLGSAMLAWLSRLGAQSRAPMPWAPLLAAAMAAGVTVLALLARGTLVVDSPLALVLPFAALGVLAVFLRDWRLLRKAEAQA